jgi:hypothetical protein
MSIEPEMPNTSRKSPFGPHAPARLERVRNARFPDSEGEPDGAVIHVKKNAPPGKSGTTSQAFAWMPGLLRLSD